jgi:hypothetical protein
VSRPARPCWCCGGGCSIPGSHPGVRARTRLSCCPLSPRTVLVFAVAEVPVILASRSISLADTCWTSTSGRTVGGFA